MFNKKEPLLFLKNPKKKKKILGFPIMSFLIANLCAQTQACQHHPHVYHLRSNQPLPIDLSGA